MQYSPSIELSNINVGGTNFVVCILWYNVPDISVLNTAYNNYKKQLQSARSLKSTYSMFN